MTKKPQAPSRDAAEIAAKLRTYAGLAAKRTGNTTWAGDAGKADAPKFPATDAIAVGVFVGPDGKVRPGVLLGEGTPRAVVCTLNPLELLQHAMALADTCTGLIDAEIESEPEGGPRTYLVADDDAGKTYHVTRREQLQIRKNMALGLYDWAEGTAARDHPAD